MSHVHLPKGDVAAYVHLYLPSEGTAKKSVNFLIPTADFQLPSEGAAEESVSFQLLPEGAVEEPEPALVAFRAWSAFSSPWQLHYASAG